MTDIQRAVGGPRTTRFGGAVVSLPGNRATVTGTVEQVGQIVAHIAATGRLVSSTLPAPTGVPGQVLINVRLVPRAQPHATRQAPPRRKLSKRAIAVIAGAVATLAGGLGWLAYLAVTAIAANLPVVLVVAGAVVVMIVLVAKTGGKTFSGTFKGKIN